MSTVEPLIWTNKRPTEPGAYVLRMILDLGWHVMLVIVVYVDGVLMTRSPMSGVFWDLSAVHRTSQWATCPKDLL